MQLTSKIILRKPWQIHLSSFFVFFVAVVVVAVVVVCYRVYLSSLL